MNNYKLFFFNIFLICNTIFAQVDSSVSNKIFKVNILSPGFSFENGLNKNTTFSIETNLSWGIVSNSNETKVLLSPYIKSQYRYYYNLNNRVLKGKDIFNNSGGFLAVSTSYYFEPFGNNKKYISTYDGITSGFVWGFQKTYKSGINLVSNAGLGYNFSSNSKNHIVPLISFTLGWVIGN